jgi:hypothetical protein
VVGSINKVKLENGLLYFCLYFDEYVSRHGLELEYTLFCSECGKIYFYKNDVKRSFCRKKFLFDLVFGFPSEKLVGYHFKEYNPLVLNFVSVYGSKVKSIDYFYYLLLKTETRVKLVRVKILSF